MEKTTKRRKGKEGENKRLKCDYDPPRLYLSNVEKPVSFMPIESTIVCSFSHNSEKIL